MMGATDLEPVNDRHGPLKWDQLQRLKTAQYYHKALIDSGLGRVNTLDI